jgi:membrane fusion protein (multidrug efflux system)
MAAAAKVREAYLALQRTRLIAPVDGFVAKRGVQLGQRVAAGSPLLTVVDLHKLWVDANFKESQLADLRMGQKVELTADVWRQDRLRRQGRGPGRRHGCGLLAAAGAERHRQLDQGGAARRCASA